MAQLARGQLLKVVTFWQCPNCKLQDATKEMRPHTRYHRCAKLGGVIAPMFPAGVKAKVVAREREDYVGREQVFYDANRRPIMSVITERADGTDALVFAPTATASGHAG